MNRSKLMTCVAFAALCFSSAAEPSQKIEFHVGNFRPLEAETSKYLTPIKRGALDADSTALSAEDRQYLAPEELGDIRKVEIVQKVRERFQAAEALQYDNDKRERDIEKLRQSMLGEPEMRPLFEGGKKLSARLSQYDQFSIKERNDMAELLQEAGGESSDKSKQTFANARLASSYQVFVDVGDLKRSVSSGNVGGVNFKDTEYRRDFIVKVLSVEKGNTVLSRTLTIRHKDTVTDVGGKIDDEIHVDMIDNAVEQIAKAIYDNFVATIAFKFKATGKVEDFEPSAISLEIIDAVSGDVIATAEHDSEVAIRKGKYFLKCDDYGEFVFTGGKTKKGPVDFSSSKTDTEVFESAYQEVKFSSNTPEDQFPSIVLVPNGWEGEEVQVNSPDVTQIRKGSYKMSATLDGYKELSDVPFMVNASTKTKTVAMTKQVSATATEVTE